MEAFHKRLDDLKNKTIEMGNFAKSMLNDGVKSLIEQDTDLANSVYARKGKLLEYDTTIEESALKLLTLYQPMASDLRTIAAILKAITYLYRIGRYGKDIAKITLKLEDRPHFKKLITIEQMGKIVSDMITKVLAAFESKDIKYLDEIEKMDDAIDDFNHSLFREVLSYIMENNNLITQGIYYIMTSRYLERCGDCACKIAEKVHYMITGELIEIK